MIDRALLMALGDRSSAGATAADVGSGVGRVAKLLQSQGLSVVGCELDPVKAVTAGVDRADVREWSLWQVKDSH